MTKEVEMTKRETGYTVRGLKVWATAGLMLMLVLSSGLALAAQIDITNCTNTNVRICAYSNNLDIDSDNAHTLDAKSGTATATGHFTCHANCFFTMIENHVNEGCHDADGDHRNPDYAEIDHSWGKGSYLLVALEMTSKGNYKSGDLQEGSTCPTAEDSLEAWEQRKDRIIEILVRDETLDLLNSIEKQDISSLFSSSGILHTFADLVSEDLISVEDGRMGITELMEEIFEEVASGAEEE